MPRACYGAKIVKIHLQVFYIPNFYAFLNSPVTKMLQKGTTTG